MMQDPQQPLAVTETPEPIQHGFEVQEGRTVPAIGDTGITSQTFCPLIKGTCQGPRCMFWVELFTHTGPGAKRVAHCAYYWNTLQLVDIKQALMRLNLLKEGSDAAPVA